MAAIKKVALVTGGAQGIGKGIAKHLLKKGYAVAITDIDKEAGDECIKEYRSLGDVIFIQIDVSKEASVIKCIQQILKHYKRIDALVNNAGIANPGNKPIESLPLKEWNHILSVNLTGCFLASKYAVPHLRKTRGAIVNIASTRAFQSEANTESYTTSKEGIVALTHALSISLGPLIRVNCISPGWIETRDWKKAKNRQKPYHTKEDEAQHPAGRVGMPGDIAGMVEYLLSDSAGFITGQNFVIDGGMTKKMIYV